MSQNRRPAPPMYGTQMLKMNLQQRRQCDRKFSRQQPRAKGAALLIMEFEIVVRKERTSMRQRAKLTTRRAQDPLTPNSLLPLWYQSCVYKFEHRKLE